MDQRATLCGRMPTFRIFPAFLDIIYKGHFSLNTHLSRSLSEGAGGEGGAIYTIWIVPAEESSLLLPDAPGLHADPPAFLHHSPPPRRLLSTPDRPRPGGLLVLIEVANE